MHQRAFAKFPNMGGGYHLVDVFAIVAIGQSTAPTGAVLFGETERYYSIEVPQEELDRAGEPDAASWCLTLISDVSRYGGRPLLQARSQDEVPMNDEDDDFGK